MSLLVLKKSAYLIIPNFQQSQRKNKTNMQYIPELEITPIPVALDNYAYIIMETESNTCVVIDVGDENAVIVSKLFACI